jgi:hypothetical protein
MRVEGPSVEGPPPRIVSKDHPSIHEGVQTEREEDMALRFVGTVSPTLGCPRVTKSMLEDLTDKQIIAVAQDHKKFLRIWGSIGRRATQEIEPGEPRFSRAELRFLQLVASGLIFIKQVA